MKMNYNELQTDLINKDESKWNLDKCSSKIAFTSDGQNKNTHLDTYTQTHTDKHRHTHKHSQWKEHMKHCTIDTINRHYMKMNMNEETLDIINEDENKWNTDWTCTWTNRLRNDIQNRQK